MSNEQLVWIERWIENQPCLCKSGAGPDVVCGRCVALAKVKSLMHEAGKRYGDFAGEKGAQ